MIERRKSRRVRVLESITVRDLTAGQTIGHIRDISRQGMMVSGPAPFVAEQMYRLRIILPRPIMGTTELDVEAICKWETIDTRSRESVGGFQFADLAPDDELVVLLMGAEYAVSVLESC